MGNKDFIKGMEAGAKPFEQKFEELSNHTKKISEKVNEKLDGLGAVMDVVMDDLSDMQKKELYNLNTPFDLKEDLDDDEKEILAALLLQLSEYTENNEYQKKFMRSVNTYIDVKSPQVGFDISRIENIENINSQKIIMQTAMEYLYLASEDFSFLEELEDEVFGNFSVNRKGIREIEGYISAVARAVGKEGIAEKYGFVPEEQQEEGKYSRAKCAEKTQEEQCPVDGSDISEACADEVNIHHHYVVLTDYLVFVDQDWSDTKIYCVHKQTGEKREIAVDIQDMGTVKACNICGYGKMIYLLHNSGIYSANIDSDKRKFKKMDIICFEGNAGSHILYAPQCNQDFLIYSRRKYEYESEFSLMVLNLKNMEMKELLLNGTQSYHLYQNVIYCVDQNSDYENVLIKYTIATEQLENIAVIEDGDIPFMEDTEFYNSTTCQYGNLVICAKSEDMSCIDEQGGYAYVDMETDTFSTKLIPDIYGGAAFVSCHYIYYLRKDSGIDRYDILTEKKEKIVGTTNCISYYEEGLFRKRTTALISKMSIQLQIVGKWIYYKEPNKNIIHKIIIDRKKDIILKH